MERLDLHKKPEHPEIEAAIHCARYAIAKPLVAGKRVLDIACGEGYGSYLLKEAGAASVVGVDIDEATIARCRESFQGPGLEFRVGRAEAVAEIFARGEFDVVISVETLEHLGDPETFLRGIKHAVKDGGTVVITCPNDGWYYGDSGRSNPFHKSRYSFEDFKKLTSSVLGKKAQWSLGTGGFGFVSTPESIKTGYETVPNSWLSRLEASGAYVVGAQQELDVRPDTCSYFVGVWGSPVPVSGMGVFPVSMDTYTRMVIAKNEAGIVPLALFVGQQEELKAAEASRDALSEQAAALRREAAGAQESLRAAVAERDKLRQQAAALQKEVAGGRERLGAVMEDRDALRRQAMELQRALESSNDQLRDARSDSSALLAQLSEVQSEREDLRQHLERLNESDASTRQLLLEAERDRRVYGLRLSAACSENTLLKESLHSSRGDARWLRGKMQEAWDLKQAAHQALAETQRQLEGESTEKSKLQEQLHSISAQRISLEQRLERELCEKASLKVGHDRYVRLRGFVPQFVRTPLAGSYRGIRRLIRG